MLKGSLIIENKLLTLKYNDYGEVFVTYISKKDLEIIKAIRYRRELEEKIIFIYDLINEKCGLYNE